MAALIAASASSPAVAEEKPLWEAGLGIGSLSFPDYRGSDETQLYPVPVPYFVYRGEFLKADRGTLRGELFNREFLELGISVNATIPVRSADHGARRGMPGLKPAVELGPSLDLHLWKSTDGEVKVDAILPLRAPLTVETSPRSMGWVFSPRVNLDIGNVGGAGGWRFGVGVGPVFADRRYHDFFYSVAPQFATADRREYQADGGYSGAHLLTAISKRFPGYWVGAWLRHDVLSGAEFKDSPLVKRTRYTAGGIGIAWMIGQSKRMVTTDE